MATQPQLQRQLKVLWPVDELCHRNYAASGHLLRLEEAGLIAIGDCELDVIAGHEVGGAHAEDVGEDGDVVGEGEQVVRYSQGHGQTLDRLIAKQAFTSTAKRERLGGGGGQDGRRQNKTGRERKKKERPGVNFICRAWHAVGGSSVCSNVFTLDRPVAVPSVGSCKRFSRWGLRNRVVIHSHYCN